MGTAVPTVFNSWDVLYDIGMKILFLAAEVAPFVKVGGLSQVMYYLPRALAKRGNDVRIFTPRYGSMETAPLQGRRWKLQPESWSFEVQVALQDQEPGEDGPADAIPCIVQSYRPKDRDAWLYFLENKEYYELRANVFGYADDHVRFALMAKACLEWLRRMREAFEAGEDGAWWPDIIHCHDWHASYCIDLARRDKRFKDLLSGTPIVLTVHNFKYQANGDLRYVPDEERDDGKEPLAPLNSKRLQKQNALKRGLLYADAVTTVSPTHALEVLTPEYAEGLDDVLLKVRGKLSGILNGIDTDELDPSSDPIIKHRYSKWRFASARAANKKDLQREFSLPADPKAFMLGYVGRLSSQKGLDLVVETLPQLLAERDDIQFVAVGGGDDRYRAGLEALKASFPEQVGLYLMPDFRLPRKIFSGADLMLIPSLFEPGGIVALEALRYGAVPLVRRTGGLNDSIEEFDPDTRRGNGFSFVKKSAWSLYGAIMTALTVHRQTPLWERLVGNCLDCDFSWDPPAKDYEAWYRQTSRERARAARTADE